MEQGVRDNNFLQLKYKFYNFYDLNPKVNVYTAFGLYTSASWVCEL